MNRKQTGRLRRSGARASGAALVFLCQSAAQACEGCKQAISPDGTETISAASLGYGWSVSFLLVTMMSVVGSLCWMIYRSCQNLERVHAAAEREASDADQGQT